MFFIVLLKQLRYIQGTDAHHCPSVVAGADGEERETSFI
jgi:hypothetical protein